MSPSSVIAPPPDREELKETERAASATLRPGAGAKSLAYFQEPAAVRRRELFAEALLDLSPTRPGTRTWDMIFSLVVHAIFLVTLIVLPLYFTEALDLKQFTQTLLVAPPPPPPPPPPPASPTIVKAISNARRVFTSGGKLLAPTVIPERVAMLKEEALPPDVGPGVAGGVPGGVPGGQAGGVIGEIISGASRTYIPPAPAAPAAPKAPLRVGGRVKAPRVIQTPDPVYPSIAKQAKIQGDVVIDAVIDPTGHVVEMRVVSGHPMLIQPAMDALRKWRYEPTYLNEQPVAVQLLVTIKFRLN